MQSDRHHAQSSIVDYFGDSIPLPLVFYRMRIGASRHFEAAGPPATSSLPRDRAILANLIAVSLVWLWSLSAIMFRYGLLQSHSLVLIYWFISIYGLISENIFVQRVNA
ncbi:MAG: hypothetical protein U0930_25875 [Pirellulales bacterium]